jgi:hypothetical protein
MLSAEVEPLRFRAPGGWVEARVRRASWPLDRLCTFAARHNARRGFLVVSKVLGRHLPARPSEIRAAADALAAELPADLPGPVAVVGLAETAVSLGRSVFDGWRRSTGRTDALYLHSTRQLADRALWVAFREPHSHAPEHLVYAPASAEAAARLVEARTLVLVDDEISTGTTLVNLADALRVRSPRVETVLLACLTDWSEAAPPPLPRVSLLSGALRWTPDGDALAGSGPTSAGGMGRAVDRCPDAARAAADLQRAVDAALSEQDERPVLVLGLGEFCHPPFQLAEALERSGVDVALQTASRSPVRLGGAIRAALAFADPYGSGAPHFVYNPPSPAQHRVLICHETPRDTVDPTLVAALGATLIGFGRAGAT